MSPPPSPRRHYAERPARPAAPRETDVMRLVQHAGPVVLGFGVGTVWVVWLGWPVYTPLLTAAFVWAITQAGVRLAAAVASQYLGGTGATTPPRKEYSAPRALAAQGRYREAAEAWELAAAESDGDPEPYVALARLLRDHVGALEDAAAWFRRARVDAHLTPGLDLLVTQELIELYLTKLHQPQRAMPELARLHDRFPDTPAGKAAAQQLRVLRDELAHRPPSDSEGGGA